MMRSSTTSPKPDFTGSWTHCMHCAHMKTWAIFKGHRMVPAMVLLVLLALFVTGCSRRRTTARTPVSTRPPLASVVGASEEGIASWYGHPYHGRRTANGEIYDQEQMTAAHPSLAFHTWVRVYNLDNGKETEVRINDRGPFAKGRAIDLSRAAAREIDMIGPGTARVRVVVTKEPPPRTTPTASTPSTPPPPAIPQTPAPAPSPTQSQPTQASVSPSGYALQFGAFRLRQNADNLMRRVLEVLPDARVVESKESPGLWLVLAGNGLGLEDAGRLAQQLDQDFPRVFPVPSH